MLRKLEKIGMFASVLCGIHCLMTPLLVVAGPSLGAHLATDHVTESWLFYTSLISSFAVLGYDYFKVHHNIRPLLLVIFGWAITLTVHDHSGSAWIWSALSGIFIVGAFLANWQIRKKTHSCEVH